MSDVDDYLATLPDAQRELLEGVRARVRALVPEADETISYGIPTFKVDGTALVYYAGWKAHCTVYPIDDDFLAAHAEALEGHRRTKGGLHFSPTAPLPDAVIDDLVRHRLERLRD